MSSSAEAEISWSLLNSRNLFDGSARSANGLKGRGNAAANNLIQPDSCPANVRWRRYGLLRLSESGNSDDPDELGRGRLVANCG